MDGNGIGAGTELNPDDNNEENAEESEDIQVDVNMDGDSGVEIDLGDEVDPEYKILCQKLNEDGKSSIPKMVSEKGEFVSVKSEEPSLPPSCSKGKSIPVNGFHPLLDECKLKLIPIADESYCKFLGTIGVVGGSLIFITANVVPPVGEHGKLTPSVPEKFPKDCLPCSDGLQLEENNKDSTSDLGNSVKDGLRYCEDPAEKPRQKSCDSQTDEDGLGTDCSRSEYKTKLQKCINMPYDAKEFADKWELASRRNELERVSDHATEKRSRSYLDLHPALAEMVDRAIARRDGCKALLLLRCLFFYNENVAHEGAFMPWKDPSYERMLLDPE
ncbi:hypothetical protein MKW94_019066 [Papaver nudicaule]|uniref:Uncharacterized protein n=1 Tax=Papaver nudicaule TaxID=74823 RepID=A0AA41V5S4_PAPNU|nr:hypothetical protein [Papaver nudicaule]